MKESSIILFCQIELYLPDSHSLKQKRSIIKSIVTRLPKEFNVATAEIGHLDVWQSSLIGLVSIGNDEGYLAAQMEKAVVWLIQHRPDVQLVDYQIQLR
jgi:uncharacterized protein